ncbi:hypothetical protein PISMIDRAFT_12174 [Pisolithus microcarpus 441]|uniref:DUF6830 domain-containing protein n=1 Tax=Pisolithus microcarpus 441 TaxID=765257 RepID=A0A0C9YAD1_9AGAM|nr:hypothetical protein PISMIDRAFT_12174 [Pisolithus microcarpus 441]
MVCHLWEQEYISFLGDPTLDGANAFALRSPNLDLAPMDDHFDGPNADYDIPEIGEGVEVFTPTTYAGHFCRGEHFKGAAIVYGIRDTFLRHFDMDHHTFHHQTNMYYPFANFGDWEMANFLLQSNLSMREVDNYLSLSMTKKMPLSFWTAKELRRRIEDLPKGPCWKLYWRDSLKCIEALFNHPFYTGKMDYSPFRVFTAAERVMRVYSEWMSSNRAWDLQTKVPIGSTLCSVILSSDKMNITNVCGGKVAHPLLISLANIRMNVRNKGSSHAFLLTALMPIAEFIYPVMRICSVLEARLFHACLDFVLEPLKKAAQFGLRQFKSGITKLKQVGGRTQRDVQRYLVVVIAGTAHPDVVAAVCALTEFRYLAQAPVITEEGCEKIAAALAKFHHYKQAIIDGGLRRGDQSGSILEHWEIPKLELLQSVVPSISQVGSVLQWSADTMEHAHIEVVKDPASRTNNKDYSSQICRHLDRVEKCRISAIKHDGDQSDGEVDHAVDDVGEAEAAVLNDLWAPKQSPSDFFEIAAKLLASTTLSSSLLHTFVCGSTAFHLNFRPTFCRLSVDAAAEKFAIPDLRSALGDYLALYNRLGRRI